MIKEAYTLIYILGTDIWKNLFLWISKKILISQIQCMLKHSCTKNEYGKYNLKITQNLVSLNITIYC